MAGTACPRRTRRRSAGQQNALPAFPPPAFAGGGAGAAALPDRRAGLPISSHPRHQLGQRLIAFVREKLHDFAHMREQISGAFPVILAMR
jgi:hypothetical protein